jgi:hypothetical protein
MLPFIGFALAAATLLFGYTTARQFVRARLRYVDAARGMRAALLAGAIACAVAIIPFALVPLPYFGMLTAALFGVSVGAGVRAGARDLGGGRVYIEGAD